MSNTIIQIQLGNNVDLMRALPESSIGAIISDPPYGLEFMGKGWDAPWKEMEEDDEEDGGLKSFLEGKPAKMVLARRAFQDWAVIWLKECHRILQPGGMIKVFGGCYDAQTDVLTARGWVPFPDVTPEDTFASLDPKTHKVEFLPPVEIVRQPHTEQMVQYRTNRVDLLVTDNHKMFVASAQHRSSNFHLVRADSHVPDVRMTKTSQGRLDEVSTPHFVLPAVEQSIGPGGVRTLPAMEIPWEKWLPFFGLWTAEGSASQVVRDTGHGYIVQVSHFDMANLREVKDLLAPWFNVCIYEKLGCAHIHSKQLCDFLQQFGYAWEKFIPDEIKRLPQRELRLFLDWYGRGDGDDRDRLYTTSPKLRDDLQEVALYAGWAADWTVEKPKRNPSLIKGRQIHPRRPSYRVALLKTQTQPLLKVSTKFGAPRSFIPAEVWAGQMVYCVELPRNHTLYVRRNGKAVWCGNTRMYHRMGTAMTLAGFKIERLEAWVYGSGFPKSHDVSKALDKMAGAKREVVGTRARSQSSGSGCYNWNNPDLVAQSGDFAITEPATDLAVKFKGYGTTLKPAWEPFLVGRKIG